MSYWTKTLKAATAAVVLTGLSSQASALGLYGIEFETTKLFRISPDDASMTLVGSTGVVNLGSLEFRRSDKKLYGVTVGTNPELYKINPEDASATLVGAVDVDFVFEGGLAISPDGRAWMANGGGSATPQLYTINLNTAAVGLVGVMSDPPHDIDGLSYRDDGMLVGLDRETNALLEIDPSNAVTSLISAVAPTVGGIGGMTLHPDAMFFNTSGPTGSIPGSNELYSFDPVAGTHSLIGSLAPTIAGQGISGLAYDPTVPEPITAGLSLLGMAGLGAATRRRRA